MAVTALIKLSQGALIGADGQALAGVDGVIVNVENSDLTDIQSWKVDLVDTPPGSTVIPGTLAMGDTNTPFASFTPDSVPGCYRLLMTVYSQPGQAGQSSIDIRNFAFPDPISGFIYPPYQDLPRKLPVLGSGVLGERPDELNFLGQEFGWSGNGSDGLLQEFMRTVSTNLGVATNFSYFDIPAGGVTIPQGQEMIVSRMITGPGILDVQGFLNMLPPDRKPTTITPAQLTSDVGDYNPPGFSTAGTVVLTSDAPRAVLGLDPNAIVKEKKVVNAGSFPLTLPHESPGTSLGSRFRLPGDSSLVINPGDTKVAFVDPTVGRWRVAA